MDFDRFRHYEFLTFWKFFLFTTNYHYICDQIQKTAVKKLYSTKFYAFLKIRPVFLDFDQFPELFKIVCDVITEIIKNLKKNYAVLFIMVQSVCVPNFMGKDLPSLEIWRGKVSEPPSGAPADPKYPGADRVNET